MAKQLREPAPSSSVARLFDMQAAARAVAAHPSVIAAVPGPDEPPLRLTVSSSHADSVPAQRSATTVSTAQRATIKREVVLTPTTDATLSRLVDMYRRATGTKLSASQVVRAMLKGAAHAMQSLEMEARALGPMKLPSNARGTELARERFESRIADVFLAGVRDAARCSGGEGESS